MSNHHVDCYKDDADEWRWRISVLTPTGGQADIVAGSSEGYKNKADCLHGLFGIFFGTWDETFLALYGEWMKSSGDHASYTIPPEATEGVPVRIEPTKDADAPNYTAEMVMKPGEVKPVPHSQETITAINAMNEVRGIRPEDD
jgi:uncharacterized protein YegP (UPF0339 family)